ncbi:MAG TPA: 50S ribosomal protein L11 methyltransferase [Candidatus Binatia bacterium]|nr:50S ribosomal protein L11 methyltransferase [Candidatus Binatia bacterium]
MAYKSMPSYWLQLSVQTAPVAVDAVSNFLMERGSPGVVIKGNEVQAYFAYSSQNSALKKDVHRFVQAISKIYPEVGERRLQWRVLKDRNWNQSWRRFFSPQKVGHFFWVTPPWAKPRRVGRRHVITIEPGMAFGTGTHATTRGCMEFIEEVAHSLNRAWFSALDVGTGSGILAIALVKLGALSVWAVDDDPVALKVARENIHLNDVDGKIFLLSKLSNVGRSFDVVVANLTAQTISDLAGQLQRKLAPKGFLIISGILKPNVKEVLRSFPRERFTLVRRKDEKEWATLLLSRK